MARNSGDIVSKIRVVDATRPGLNSAKRNITSFARDTSSVVTGILASQGVAAAGRSLGGVIAEGFNTLQFQQTLKTQLDIVLRETKRVEGAFDFINEFATRTPFLLNDVGDAYRQVAIQIGGSAQEMETWIKRIADVAALANMPLNEIAATVGRAVSFIRGGQTAGDELRRLTEVGAITNDIRKDVEALLKAGDTQGALAALTEGLGMAEGAAAAAARTIGGLLSTLRGVVGQEGANLIDTLFGQNVEGVIIGITQGIERFGDAAEAMIRRVQREYDSNPGWQRIMRFLTPDIVEDAVTELRGINPEAARRQYEQYFPRPEPGMDRRSVGGRRLTSEERWLEDREAWVRRLAGVSPPPSDAPSRIGQGAVPFGTGAGGAAGGSARPLFGPMLGQTAQGLELLRETTAAGARRAIVEHIQARREASATGIVGIGPDEQQRIIEGLVSGLPSGAPMRGRGRFETLANDFSQTMYQALLGGPDSLGERLKRGFQALAVQIGSELLEQQISRSFAGAAISGGVGAAGAAGAGAASGGGGLAAGALGGPLGWAILGGSLLGGWLLGRGGGDDDRADSRTRTRSCPRPGSFASWNNRPGQQGYRFGRADDAPVVHVYLDGREVSKALGRRQISV